ncbi:gp53-like domain-containing protein [Chitiniphilus eburneus]|uniref:Putative tail fiber protein gp53-like C-terminal domain-containing protein n=1 Tax=Chitiniphilus eburneus TaxID=2571148 RepID=A0A4U0Q3C9_9NEIS|nr:hypothetical protein [Chitiniphilus eburneus]TJZ75567.1 hypothetical protein FAZ21_06530 [Chitiniphilus eburneus]
MPTNDFLVFGGDAAANVMSQAAYAGLAARTAGFSAGTAQSAQLNKVWRQASIMSATLAQYIADQTGNDVLDNGTVSTILASLKAATAVTVTPPQFDNDTSVATTAFVQRALGNYAGNLALSTSQTLTAAHAGRTVNVSGTITLTLPASTSVGGGATYQINNAGVGVVTVQAGGGDSLYAVGNGTPRQLTLGSGDTLTVVYVGGTSWYAWGVGQLAFSAVFASSNPGITEYQRLPGGLIVQYGAAQALATNETRTITLPTAYLTAMRSVVLTGDGAPSSARVASLGLTSFQIQNQGAAAQNVYWVALGR